jgi:hypothetical protein
MPLTNAQVQLERAIIERQRAEAEQERLLDGQLHYTPDVSQEPL